MARRAEQGQAAGLVSPPIMQRTEGRGGDAPAFLLRFDRLFEAREPRRRGSRVGADPAVVDVLDRHRVEMVPAFAAAAFGDDEAGILRLPPMLHPRSAVDVGKTAAQRAGRPRSSDEIRVGKVWGTPCNSRE